MLTYRQEVILQFLTVQKIPVIEEEISGFNPWYNMRPLSIGSAEFSYKVYIGERLPVLLRSLKSSILSSTSLQKDWTFWGVVSASVEQSRRKATTVAWGDGKFGPWGWPQDPSKQKQKSVKGSNSFQMDKPFWGVMSASVMEYRCKATLVSRGDRKFGPEADPRIPPNQKKANIQPFPKSWK